MGLILLIVLILLLVGALPRWNHSRNWGYAPTSVISVILIVIVVLLFMDVVRWRF